MNEPDDLIRVYEAANVTEAHFVKNLLADAGIKASVAEENEPLASLPITPSDVLIFRRDEAQARAIIDEYDAEQERPADRPDWKCASAAPTSSARSTSATFAAPIGRAAKKKSRSGCKSGTGCHWRLPVRACNRFSTGRMPVAPTHGSATALVSLPRQSSRRTRSCGVARRNR